MQILIRFIHRDRKGREELYEEILEDPGITVGHGSDQAIQLLDPAVAQRHLELKARGGGRFDFKTVGGTRVVLNGASVNRGSLKLNDQLELGEQTITVVEPTAGFDAMLEVTTIEQKVPVGAVTHHRTELAQTGLSMRRPAWWLFAGILLLFLAIPLAGYFWPELDERLKQSPFLPSDHVWSPGPLANPHHIPEIGQDCNVCHQKLFERSPDRACLDCHADVSGHVDRQAVAVPSLELMRCATCHREHKEPSVLVRRDSGLCLECHRRPEQKATVLGEGGLPEPVEGFSRATHPEFRLAMLRQLEGNGEWHIERRVRSEDDLMETSNLKFPHDLHLDSEKVVSLRTGRPLDCASCHILQDDGEHFVPITMESACQSCHSLAFDDDFPFKELPHGNVEAALVALEEHYIRKNADPALQGDGGERGRRRPGRVESTQRCEGSVLECGREQALQEAVSQFSRSGCVTCHEVHEYPERPMMERWQVREVKLADNWYPFSRFNHEVHQTRSRTRLDEQSACLTCHAAQTSASSADVLIPGLDNCVQCHGDDKPQLTSVTLTCSGCHDFHLATRDAMKVLNADATIRADLDVTHDNRYDNRGQVHE